MFKLYFIPSYSLSASEFESHSDSFNLEDAKEQLSTDACFHFRVHPATRYIFFGDLDNYTKGIEPFINLLCDFMVARYGLEFDKELDFKYTKNTAKAGSYHYSIPKWNLLTEKIKEINNDCTIHFDGLYYYICVPEIKQMKINNNSNWICSIDPGIRKFQTIYSPDNDNYITIGEKASSVLYNNLLKLDKLFSKRNSKNILKIKKLRLKIDNLQRELHYKTINFLCNNYKNIYIPKLTKQNDIIKVFNRKINCKTVRNMVVL